MFKKGDKVRVNPSAYFAGLFGEDELEVCKIRQIAGERCLNFKGCYADEWFAESCFITIKRPLALGTLVGIPHFDIVAPIKRSLEIEGTTCYELEGFSGLWKEGTIEVIKSGESGLKESLLKLLRDTNIIAQKAELRDLPQETLDEAAELALSVYTRLVTVSTVKSVKEQK